MPTLDVHVRARRARLGLSQAALADRVGIGRQALLAIEAGRSVPSTVVALRLAAVLGCAVEDLFAVADALPVDVVGDVAPGSRLRVGRVGQRWVGHALPASAGGSADAVLAGPGAAEALRPASALEHNLLVAGCAPLIGVLADRLSGADGRVAWIPAASGHALDLLARGLVHVAGLHLYDDAEGTFNEAAVRARFSEPMVLVTLCRWREGLLRRAGDARPADALAGVPVARRSDGAGATGVLRRHLAAAGLAEADLGPGPLVDGHAEAAHAVRLGAVDVAVGIEAAARDHGLGFVPLAEERFDLVVRAVDLARTERLFDELAGAGFRREVRGLGVYDVEAAGEQRRIG